MSIRTLLFKFNKISVDFLEYFISKESFIPSQCFVRHALRTCYSSVNILGYKYFVTQLYCSFEQIFSKQKVFPDNYLLFVFRFQERERDILKIYLDFALGMQKCIQSKIFRGT